MFSCLCKGISTVCDVKSCVCFGVCVSVCACVYVFMFLLITAICNLDSVCKKIMCVCKNSM